MRKNNEGILSLVSENKAGLWPHLYRILSTDVLVIRVIFKVGISDFYQILNSTERRSIYCKSKLFVGWVTL